MGADETVAVRVTVEAAGLGPEAAAREAQVRRPGRGRRATLAPPPSCSGTPATTRPRRCCWGWRAARAAAPWPACAGRSTCYRRPLLDVARADTVTACQVEGLEIWDDPHNADPAYLRSRVRARVLPLLEDELGPGVAAALARTADQLRVDAEHLDDLADRARRAWPTPPTVAELVRCPPPYAAGCCGSAGDSLRARPPAEVFHEHVLAVDALLTDWHGQKWVDLPGHVRAVRRDSVLLVGRRRRDASVTAT